MTASSENAIGGCQGEDNLREAISRKTSREVQLSMQ